MQKKDKLDLHNPTPIIDPPKPPAPTPPEPKRPEPKVEKPEPKKKRSSLLPGLLAGVVLAGAVFALYRTVHFWSDATCVARAKCSICGLEQEDYADHTWIRSACDEPMTCSVCGAVGDAAAGHNFIGGSCTEPAICSVCGEPAEQAPGHSFRDGICTICGAEATNTILKWEDLGYGAVYEYDGTNSVLSVKASDLAQFAEDKITILDYTGKTELSTERYTISRSDGKVYIDLPADLEPGRYTVCSGYFQTKVADFYLGMEGDAIPSAVDCWFADFETKNLQHGLYLAAFEENAPLRGVQTVEEATRFASPWQMSGADFAEDGSAVLMQGGSKQKFVIDDHRIFSNNGAEIVFTFRYNSWYLAMDADGTVYLTDTLADNCYWTITSSL